MSPTTESDQFFDVEIGTDCQEVDSPHSIQASDQETDSLESIQTSADAKTTKPSRQALIIFTLVFCLCGWVIGTHASILGTSKNVDVHGPTDDRRSLLNLKNVANQAADTVPSFVEKKAHLLPTLQEIMQPFEDGSRSDLISLPKLDLKNILKYYYEYVPEGMEQMSNLELAAQVQTLLDAAKAALTKRK